MNDRCSNDPNEFCTHINVWAYPFAVPVSPDVSVVVPPDLHVVHEGLGDLVAIDVDWLAVLSISNNFVNYLVSEIKKSPFSTVQ